MIPISIHAAQAQTNPAADLNDEDIENRYIARVLEQAAEYRLDRVNALVSEADEVAAAEYARQARLILDTGETQPLEGKAYKALPQWWFRTASKERRAGWLASAGFAEYPFTQASGSLLALQVLAHARRGNILDMHNALYKLWYFVPSYDGMPSLMEAVMDATERSQNFTAAIDLEADDPRDVIKIGGETWAQEINKVYRFMVRHGDRVEIAPRAALGLARSLLRKGDRDAVIIARREYEKFGEQYPTHRLVFNSLCERALSYLISYRGEQYDVGVLISAAAVIDQAEIEAEGNPEKVALVEAYRRRIRAWHQARDLVVARWYLARVTPGFAWLMSPQGNTDRPWLLAARYFYREVIRRDSGSEAGRAAQRELAELPLPTAAELGAPLTPEPTTP